MLRFSFIKKCSSSFPRLHDLSLCTLFASPKSLPWVSGSISVREPPTIPMFSSSSSSSNSDIDFTKQKLKQILENYDSEFVKETLKKEFIDGFVFSSGSGGNITKRNDKACIHLPASLYLSLLEEESPKSSPTSWLFDPSSKNINNNSIDDENSSSSHYVNFWIHCSSFSQVQKVASKIMKMRQDTRKVGICLPFPANSVCGHVLFGIDNIEFQHQGENIDNMHFLNRGDGGSGKHKTQTDLEEELLNEDQQEQNQKCSEYEENVAQTLQILAEENIPSAIWLISGLTCPFGGPNATDPVEVSDHIITFIQEFGCNEIFVDDTAGTIHSRLFSDFMKTLIAVLASSPAANFFNPDDKRSVFDKISFCFRTSQDNMKIRKMLSSSSDQNISSSSTKQITHRSHETILLGDLNERIYRNVTKGYSFAQSSPATAGLLNFCGSVITDKIDQIVVKEDKKPTNTFVPLPLFGDWYAELHSSEFKVDPLQDNSETTIEAQKRFDEMEKDLVKNVTMLRKMNDMF